MEEESSGITKIFNTGPFRHTHCTKPGCTGPLGNFSFVAAQDITNGSKDIMLCQKHTEEFNKWYYGLNEASDAYVPKGYVQDG